MSAATCEPPLEVEVSSIGVRYAHEPSFTIDRPHGSGDYVFVHFLTPVWMLLDQIRVRQPAECCMVFAPAMRQWFSGIDHPLIANWFHFHGHGARATLERLGMPVGVPIAGRGFPFVEPLLREMEREYLRHESRWDHALQALAALCLLRVARADQDQLHGPSPRLRSRIDELRAVRALVRARPQQRWTLAGMSRLARLSPSRFSALYRECFGVSPIDDVIAGRIEHARGLLTNTSLPIAEVARQSGFDSGFHFSRLFRRRMGCAPRDYYRMMIVAPSASRVTRGTDSERVSRK